MIHFASSHFFFLTFLKRPRVTLHRCRRGKTALLEGNLDTLTKLVTKGKKLLPEVVQDRRQKVGARSTARMHVRHLKYDDTSRCQFAGGESEIPHPAGA